MRNTDPGERSSRRSPSISGAIALAAAIVAAASAVGCSSGAHQALYMTVERYLAAMQQRDDEGLAFLWAPYLREVQGLKPEEEKKKYAVFRSRIRKANMLYDLGKRDGVLSPDPLGVALFRALGLGKGANSLPLAWSIEEGGATAHVRTRVVTNFETLHLESLPDGVRVYLMGYPFGKIEMVAVGFEKLSDHRLLESVDIDWTLSRAPTATSTPGRWLIESLAVDPNSAVEWKPPAR